MAQHYGQLPNPHSSHKSEKLQFFSNEMRHQNQFQHVNVCSRDPNPFRAMQVHATPKLPLIACKGAEGQIPQSWILLSTQLIQSEPCKISLWEKDIVPYSIPKNPACKMSIFIPFPVVLISCLAAQPAPELCASAGRSQISQAQVRGIFGNTFRPGLQCSPLSNPLAASPARSLCNLFVLVSSSRCNFVPSSNFPV